MKAAMSISTTSFLFLSSPSLPPLSRTPQPSFFSSFKLKPLILQTTPTSRRNPFLTRADDGDVEPAGPDDYEMDDDEMEEVDNKKDFDIEYEANGDVDIAAVQSTGFVSTQGWDPDTLVDYRINEDEFHKISLLDCDFFIRKPPDPDNDVYDFREVGATLWIKLNLFLLLLLLI